MFVNFNVNDGEWFPFQLSQIDTETGKITWSDPMPDARMQIRSMTPFFEERISSRKRAVERVLNPKTRQMERISYYEELSPDDAKKERDDAYDYAITGFDGFRDAVTKKDIPVTRDTKLALMKMPIIDRFFAKCQEMLAGSGVKIQEGLEKNLSSGSSSAS
jgi:hypothetical protein